MYSCHGVTVLGPHEFELHHSKLQQLHLTNIRVPQSKGSTKVLQDMSVAANPFVAPISNWLTQECVGFGSYWKNSARLHPPPSWLNMGAQTLTLSLQSNLPCPPWATLRWVDLALMQNRTCLCGALGGLETVAGSLVPWAKISVSTKVSHGATRWCLIYLSTLSNLSIYLSFFLCIYLSIFLYFSIFLSIFLSIYLSIYLILSSLISFHLFSSYLISSHLICLSFFLCFYLSFYLFFYLAMYLSIF